MQEPDSSFGYPAPPRRSYIEFGPQDRQRIYLPKKTSRPIRRSRSLQEHQLRKRRSSRSSNEIEPQHDDFGPQDQKLPPPSSNRTHRAGSPRHLIPFSKIDIGNRKRKVESVVEDIQSLSPVLDEPHHRKRSHTSKTVSSTAITFDHIQHWTHEFSWPKGDFEAGPKTVCLVSKQSDAEIPVLSHDQSGSPYAQSGYMTLLADRKGYMHDSKVGILASEADDCKLLLNTPQPFPSGSLFDDKCFFECCANLENENETRIVIDLLRLIVPSAEALAARGNEKLKCLKEHTNAGWNEAISVAGPRPQPGYSVGFRFGTFSVDQINKLHRHLRFKAKTFFLATLEMLFPFLTSEVHRVIDIADRENAHSMTIAIRGVVELFRKVGRAEELHRKALGFSISHNDQEVRIYVHYSEIDGVDTSCYRHLLKNFLIRSENGKERWSGYRFVRNVYDSFVPRHLERIKSAIDELPSPLEPFQSTLSTDDAESSNTMTVPNIPSPCGSVAEVRAQNKSLVEKELESETEQGEEGEDGIGESKQWEKKILQETAELMELQARQARQMEELMEIFKRLGQ